MSSKTAAKTMAESAALPQFAPLPHLDVPCLSGLLEKIVEDGGRDDVPVLAHLRNLDIMPMLDLAQMLGFAEVEQADVILTPEGRAFAEATIPERKALLHQQALAHVPLLTYLVQMLEHAPHHELPVAFVLKLLHGSNLEEDVEQPFMTLVEWGRNARLFAYDSRRATIRRMDQ